MVKTTKAYVRDNGIATIVCPNCGITKNINSRQLKIGRHTIKLRCKCNTVFAVQIDFRRSYRKPTNLPGTYTILNGGQGGGVIHIRNISKGGIGFTVSGVHTLEKGQMIGVEFQLTDRNMTNLKKKASVVSIINNQIGCRFQADDEIGKALGFFLQS